MRTCTTPLTPQPLNPSPRSVPVLGRGWAAEEGREGVTLAQERTQQPAGQVQGLREEGPVSGFPGGFLEEEELEEQAGLAPAWTIVLGEGTLNAAWGHLWKSEKPNPRQMDNRERAAPGPGYGWAGQVQAWGVRRSHECTGSCVPDRKSVV